MVANKMLTDQELDQLSSLGVLAVSALDAKNSIRAVLPKRLYRHIDDGFYTSVKGYRKAARGICPDYSPLRLRGGEFLTDCQSGFERKDGYDVESGSVPTAFRSECQHCELYTRLMEAKGAALVVQPPKKEDRIMSQGNKHRENSFPMKWALTAEEQKVLLDVMEASMTSGDKLKQFDELCDRQKMRDYPGHNLGSVVAKWLRPLACDRDLLYYWVKRILDSTREALKAGSPNTIRQELYNQTVNWIGSAAITVRGFIGKPLFEQEPEQPSEAPKVVSMPVPVVVPEVAQTTTEAGIAESMYEEEAA